MLEGLDGCREDCPAFREALRAGARAAWAAPPADLKRLDLRRGLRPDRFQRPDMSG
jgi:hypothetical protein